MKRPMLEEGLFDMTCEAVTDDQIDEWLDNEELPRTDDNIDLAVTRIALKKLGWDKPVATLQTWAKAMTSVANELIKSQTRK